MRINISYLLILLILSYLLIPIVTSAATADKTKPTISGAKDTIAYLNHSFDSKKGVTAKDNIDGNITSLIKITGKVNTKKLGKYTLTYKVADTSKNSTTVKRVVTVIKDKTKPTISGASNKTIYLGYSFNTKSGIKATDNADGDITSKVKVTGKLNTKKTGTYKLSYTVSDRAKNTRTVTRVLTVKKDTTKPKLSGITNKIVYKGYSFNAKTGIKASDNIDGDITNKITISGKVNTNEVGIYKLKYNVKDKTGNQTSVTRTITVKKDTTKPVLTGADNKTISYKDTFDPKKGVKAVDNVDGTITNRITISGNVNSRKPGTYKLTYTVKDKTGNQSIITRTIKVIDNVKPILTGYELRDRSIYIGTSFNPLYGITATDAIDGNLTSQIKVDGILDVNKAGIYKLIYSVTDKANNKTTFERTITVVDNIQPSIDGTQDTTIYYLEDFDPMTGVTAIDNNDGDITSNITVKGEKIDTSDLSFLGYIYMFEYSVIDAAGNETTVKRIVKLEPRPAKLFGIDNIKINVGEEFDPLAGVTAVDNLNGKDITSLIQVGWYLDVNVPDTYTLVYNIVYGSGYYSADHYRKITVVDNIPPTITGIEDITIPQNSKLPDLSEGVEIYDNIDGNISLRSLTINTDNVDVSTEGNYIVTYTVSDKAGNIAEYQSTVRVKKVPVTKIELSIKHNNTTVKIGETKQILANIYPSDASFPEISWTSSDETIATVNEEGMVNTLAEGTVTITATADGLQDSITLNVTDRLDLRLSAGWASGKRQMSDKLTIIELDLVMYNNDKETVNIDSIKVFDSNGSVVRSYNRKQLDELEIPTILKPSREIRMEIDFFNAEGPLPDYNNKFSVFATNTNGRTYEYSHIF